MAVWRLGWLGGVPTLGYPTIPPQAEPPSLHQNLHAPAADCAGRCTSCSYVEEVKQASGIFMAQLRLGALCSTAAWKVPLH